jgi:hypothetical protein
MVSLQVPASTADESQQNNTQYDEEFEQIEAPVTFKVWMLVPIGRISLTVNP